VVGEAQSGAITGYAVAGVIAAVSTGISMLLAGRLRVAEEEIAEAAVAVDSPEDSPLLAAPGPSPSTEAST
jgi:hypothetical protein